MSLRNKLITHPRSYIYPDPKPIPSYDYDLIYPITVYEAVHRSLDDASTTLDQELESIYRLISNKQDIIQGKPAGHLMVWSATPGYIDDTEILTAVNSVKSRRSTTKVVSESAIGAELDKKADNSMLIDHITNSDIHCTEEDRDKWNSMTPKSDFDDHVNNTDLHVTGADKARWDSKADGAEIELHMANGLNPHGVTAHQTGTYDRDEIDDMVSGIKDSFFHYKNIKYDEDSNTASLEEYEEAYVNPTYVLAWGDDIDTLPDKLDPNLTYYALRPVTDYSTNETEECKIYRRAPRALDWEEVGTSTMVPGDMVIRYPDTAFFVWLAGRFIELFSATSTQIPEGPFEGYMWRPVVDELGVLTWTRSNEQTPPDPITIKGEPGYTPRKGYDYFDGEPGIGVPAGGDQYDIIVKTDSEDYATEWMSLNELLDILGQELGGGESGPSQPQIEIVQETGQSPDKVMSQKAVTDELDDMTKRMDGLEAEIGVGDGNAGMLKMLEEHISDHSNPHRVTADSIGAVSLQAFAEHTTNQDNPHGVTKEQLGLSHVNDTSDLDKPVSAQQQIQFDEVNARIDELYDAIQGDNVIMDVKWNDATCTLSFLMLDGSTLDVPIPLIDIFSTIYYEDGDLHITLPDGTIHVIPVKDLIAVYKGSVGKNIEVTVDGDTIGAHIIAKSVTGEELADDIVLRGAPSAPTQLPADTSKKVATTEFVKDVVIDNLTSYDTDRPLSANMGRILNTYKTDVEDVLNILADTPMMNVVDSLMVQDKDAALSANMGHELFIQKAPKVHTSPSSSTYGRATADLFGHARASNVEPLMAGIPFIGTDDGYYARADHRHPADGSRAPVHFPDPVTGVDKFTGAPRAETPQLNSDDDRIATTEWVNDIIDERIGGSMDPISDEDIKASVNEVADALGFEVAA